MPIVSIKNEVGGIELINTDWLPATRAYYDAVALAENRLTYAQTDALDKLIRGIVVEADGLTGSQINQLIENKLMSLEPLLQQQAAFLSSIEKHLFDFGRERTDADFRALKTDTLVSNFPAFPNAPTRVALPGADGAGNVWYMEVEYTTTAAGVTTVKSTKYRDTNGVLYDSAPAGFKLVVSAGGGSAGPSPSLPARSVPDIEVFWLPDGAGYTTQSTPALSVQVNNFLDGIPTPPADMIVTIEDAQGEDMPIGVAEQGDGINVFVVVEDNLGGPISDQNAPFTITVTIKGDGVNFSNSTQRVVVFSLPIPDLKTTIKMDSTDFAPNSPQRPFVLAVDNVGAGDTYVGIVLKLNKPPNYTLNFNPTGNISQYGGGTLISNANYTLTENALFFTLTRNAGAPPIPAGGQENIGLGITRNAGSSAGTQSITSNMTGGSGGDKNSANNSFSLVLTATP